MVLEFEALLDHLFAGLSSCDQYLTSNNLAKVLRWSPPIENQDLQGKFIKSTYFSVSPDNDSAFPVEIDDLIRLHFLMRSRLVTTVLEFGVGKSTIVFDDALKLNQREYSEVVTQKLRRADAFKCFTVDNSERWLDEIRLNHDLSTVTYHFSDLEMGTFLGRACTYYSSLPNVCPDLIYLDGPDQFSVLGDIRGISTAHPDRLPMAADILVIEHLLLPGTLVVVDGRSANARFLKANLQRGWLYCYSPAFDQHFFELAEMPLGVYNKRQVEFQLGESFFERVSLLARY